MTIAVSMPGKIGDALYALPTARLLYGIHGEKIDFYTSNYCEPMRSLVSYQSYINAFMVPQDYTIERMDMGVQPWRMPIPDRYTHIFQLGFKGIPDRAIHQYIAHTIGYDMPLAIRYDYPELNLTLPEKYICVAPRGVTSFMDTFDEVIDTLPKGIKAIVIGGRGDYTGYGIDFTGASMLETLYILSKSIGFIGLMSSQLVLANGFDIPRIAIHDGKSWDMKHCVYTARNYYPINPTAKQIKEILDIT